MDSSLGHGQHPRQRGHVGRHAGRFPSRRAVLHPATKHVVLAALRRGRLPQRQELHTGASERHSCPLRHRRLIRRLGNEQGMAAPVFGRMGISCSHGLVREEPGVDNWMASLSNKRGCGSPVKAQAQASARVDVPTARVFPVWTKESNTCASFCCECLDMCSTRNRP